MRIFEDFIEAHNEVKRELLHNGVIYQSQTWQDQDVSSKESFQTKELIGYTFIVKNPEIDRYIETLELNSDWIAAEFIERTGQERLNPGEAWKHRESTWSEFIHDGQFSYTYSDRINDQAEDVISLLRQVPHSRHGIINIYYPEIDNQRRISDKRVPCTMYYQFFIREEDGEQKLQCLYNIRSNDFATHFPYDITLARMLQEYIAHELGLNPGIFIYQSGSLHIFKKDQEEIF